MPVASPELARRCPRPAPLAETTSSVWPRALGRGRANRVVHRVARRERGRDDRRAEHQPDDDQRRARAAAADVADAELQQHPVAHGEQSECARRDREQHGEDEQQRVHRDAEQFVHRVLLADDGRLFGEHDLVRLAAGRRAVERHELLDLLAVEAPASPRPASAASSLSQKVSTSAWPSGETRT